MKTFFVASLSAVIFLTACSKEPDPQPVYQQPVVQEAPPQQIIIQEDSDMSEALVAGAVGAAAGYAIANSGNNSSTYKTYPSNTYRTSQPTIVNKTVVQEKPKINLSKPSTSTYTRPSERRTYTTKTTTVTKTTRSSSHRR